MSDYLINHAIKNVWCSPQQDLQMIFKPARISRFNGVEGSMEVLRDIIPLPTKTDRYYVYQVGQLHPKLVGLFSERNVWHCAANVMGREDLIIDIYTKAGIQFPRTGVWILVNHDQNLLLAVKEQIRIPVDLNTEPLYFRFYSNAFFDSARADHNNDVIHVSGGVIKTVDQLLLLQNEFALYKAKHGHTYAFHNGNLVKDFTLAFVRINDVVEFVYDSSIDRVVTLPILNMPTFDSLLDYKRKFLIHYPETLNEFIEYRDDVDFFLVKKNNTPEGFRGYYYHRNKDDSVRMVTHKDYSIPVPYIASFAADNPGIGVMDDLTLVIHIRKSGYFRPLVNEHQRIKELYKLDDQQIQEALLGINSTLTEWRADNLEASGYVRIMRAADKDITPALVQNSYGYNAVSKLVADTPTRTEQAQVGTVANLPVALGENSTAYEYDKDGVLLGFYRHNLGNVYRAVINECALVEAVVGLGGNSPSITYDRPEQVYNPKFNYRFYTSPIRNGSPTEVWTDVTGTANYVIEDGLIKWRVDRNRVYTMVKSDEKFLSYSFTIDREDGLMNFSVISTEFRGNQTITGPMRIPPGELDIWLNGHPLIEDLDYYVKWPQVILVNKEFLLPTTAQQVTVRAMGFCKRDLTREPPTEVGFVEHGLLSRNRVFNVRDDKVVRFVVNGTLQHRDALLFSEDDNGVRVANVRNGAPYVIKDVVVPLRDLVDEDAYSFREKSRVIDQKISDYLTLKLPEAANALPNAIPERYQVYSPFCSKILHDLISGFIGGPEIQGQYSNQQILGWLKNYEYLLAFDPTQKTVDTRYVAIHPHNLFTILELNIFQYKFLERVIALYLNGKVDLTRFVKMRPFA